MSSCSLLSVPFCSISWLLEVHVKILIELYGDPAVQGLLDFSFGTRRYSWVGPVAGQYEVNLAVMWSKFMEKEAVSFAT